jgi:hypothetical protein
MSEQMPIPKPYGEGDPYMNPVVLKPGEISQGQHYFDEIPSEPKKQTQPEIPSLPPNEPPDGFNYDFHGKKDHIESVFDNQQNTYPEKNSTKDKTIGSIIDESIDNTKKLK